MPIIQFLPVIQFPREKDREYERDLASFLKITCKKNQLKLHSTVATLGLLVSRKPDFWHKVRVC